MKVIALIGMLPMAQATAVQLQELIRVRADAGDVGITVGATSAEHVLKIREHGGEVWCCGDNAPQRLHSMCDRSVAGTTHIQAPQVRAHLDAFLSKIRIAGAPQ